MRHTAGPRSSPVVTYQAAKAALNLTLDDDRTKIIDLIEEASDHMEAETDSTIGQRQVVLTLDEGETEVVLPAGPVVSITSVVDANAAPVSHRWRTIGNRDTLALTSAAAFPVTVTYQAGHAPPSLRKMIREWVVDGYLNPGSTRDGTAKPDHRRLIDLYSRSPRVV